MTAASRMTCRKCGREVFIYPPLEPEDAAQYICYDCDVDEREARLEAERDHRADLRKHDR